MIKRNITETVYEYDKEGKLLKKTVIETHEEEENTITLNPNWVSYNDLKTLNDYTTSDYTATITTNVTNKCTYDGNTSAI